MNIDEVTPGPWRSTGDRLGARIFTPMFDIAQHLIGADAEFIVLARQAFDIITRRGWSPHKDILGKYFVKGPCLGEFRHLDTPHPEDKHGNVSRFDDPFTALIEAENWYVANVEGGK